MNTTEIGKTGELLAKNYLALNNYEIVQQNYRHQKGEIDIIAKKDEILVFFEVKFRKNNDFGFPEQSITLKKINLLKKTAQFYLEEINWEKNIRFDIIAITQKKYTKVHTENDIELVHFEDCF